MIGMELTPTIYWFEKKVNHRAKLTKLTKGQLIELI